MDLNNYLSINWNKEEVLSTLEDSYHDNWGLQWTKFNKLQLDSYNGSTESEDRLLEQCELKGSEFKNKTVLEIGAGNGRFTEVLLNFGAKIIAIDYSSAIFANFENHVEEIKKGNLICIRADLFNLPVKENKFDFVLCYGVVQHTGNNQKCLETISKYLNTNGHLLVDVYSNSLKHYNPWIYLIRPFFSRINKEEIKMKLVERFVNLVFPLQLFILRFLHNRKGLFKYLKYVVNRSPNSVYGINLYLDKKISLKNAKEWSVCDTFDAWSPNHDDPVSYKEWLKLLSLIEEKFNLSIILTKECGQGNCAVLTKQSN